MPCWKTSQLFSEEELRLAYVAGLIDGEGCIGIQRSHRRSGEWFYPEVTIGMTSKAMAVLRMMEREFGGTVHQQRKTRARWASAWKWRIGGVAAFGFLEKILPYLILKKPQAGIALALKFTPKQGHPELKSRMHALNKKGPRRLPEGAFAMLVDGEWVTGQLLLDGTSERFSTPWPRAGMTCAGTAYRLQPSEPLTRGIASGCLLPTPNLPNGGRVIPADAKWSGKAAYRQDGKKCQVGIESYVRQWPTPRASEGKGNAYQKDRNGNVNLTLAGAVRLWPTPCAGDAIGAKGNWSGTKRDHWKPSLREAAKLFPTPLTRDARSFKGAKRSKGSEGGEPLSVVVGGTLNPMWVEWLMGWPIGWTACGPLETAKFQQWLSAHGRS